MTDRHEDDAVIEAHVRGILKKHLRPELLNRIDETVIFHALSREQLGGIVEIQLGNLRKRLAARGITLGVTAAATVALASEGFDPQFGARPLKRVIQQRIENGLAGKILAGEIGDGDSVRVDYQGKSFVFTKVTAAAAAGGVV
jgi:ATP-dependent Clp protease ATP-binding subunit ClpB